MSHAALLVRLDAIVVLLVTALAVFVIDLFARAPRVGLVAALVVMFGLLRTWSTAMDAFLDDSIEE